MRPIRVLIMSGSTFISKRICDILKPDHRIGVVGIAMMNSTVEMKQNIADVILLAGNIAIVKELNMLKQAMKQNPIPILVLSEKDFSEEELRMFGCEVIGLIPKSPRSITLDDELLKKVIVEKMMKVRPITYVLSRQLIDSIKQEMNIRNGKTCFKPMLIVIGASAGGPRALQQVISDLPKNFNSPVLIVQHMPEGFTKSLAKRLDSLSKLRVKEAEHGEEIRGGNIYIAPGGVHMKAVYRGEKIVIKLTNNHSQGVHRPSVDVLFESVSHLSSVKKIAVVLTGMGTDGAKGIVHMKEKDDDVIVIGESEKTSLVYGMPRAAFKTGYVDKVLPIHEIGTTLQKLTNS